MFRTYFICLFFYGLLQNGVISCAEISRTVFVHDRERLYLIINKSVSTTNSWHDFWYYVCLDGLIAFFLWRIQIIDIVASAKLDLLKYLITYVRPYGPLNVVVSSQIIITLFNYTWKRLVIRPVYCNAFLPWNDDFQTLLFKEYPAEWFIFLYNEIIMAFIIFISYLFPSN